MTDRIALLPPDKIDEVAELLAASPEIRANYTPYEIKEINRRARDLLARKGSTAETLQSSNNLTKEASVAAVLKVRDVPYTLDKVATSARQATGEQFRQRLNKTKKADRIVSRGMTAVVDKVTKRLNARGLEDIERTLLALPNVYEYLLIQALDTDGVDENDEQGLTDAVLRSIAVAPRQYFLTEILGSVLDEEKIKLNEPALEALRQLLFDKKGIALRKGSVQTAVMALVDDGRELGELRRWVDRFAARGEIDDALFDEVITTEMARFLYAKGIYIRDKMSFEEGEYDEYFALAYYHATRVSEGTDDPVDVARRKGSVADWNFQIRRISDLDRPVVNEKAIRAAGALYTTFVEGELMHVYDITDSLLTEWHRGELDIPDGKAAALLNRYEILMRDRPTEEERFMHYRRVFNIGDAEVLSGTVVNSAFPGYWDNMMYEVTRWVDKMERYYTDEKVIRRTDIYHTVQNLQYNLSEYMTGSTPKKTHEMYRALDDALELIGSEDVVNHYGGRRKSILSVIEAMGRKPPFQVAIPAQDLVTIAERGNDIFQFIATFAAENVSDDEFHRFVDDCKAWITSQGAMESEGGAMHEVDSRPGDHENGYGARRRSDNGYSHNDRNGDRDSVGSFNGYGPRQVSGVGGRNANGKFDDWDS